MPCFTHNPQNGDRVVSIDSMTSLHPIYTSAIFRKVLSYLNKNIAYLKCIFSPVKRRTNVSRKQSRFDGIPYRLASFLHWDWCSRPTMLMATTRDGAATTRTVGRGSTGGGGQHHGTARFVRSPCSSAAVKSNQPCKIFCKSGPATLVISYVSNADSGRYDCAFSYNNSISLCACSKPFERGNCRFSMTKTKQ